ncbi:MAG: hypothetical protein GXP42_15105 [Chloroflexi bacterium]|nr:hypothetical protein [Chloroflexota bacterium]
MRSDQYPPHIPPKGGLSARTIECFFVFFWLGVGMLLRVWSFGWFPPREDEALYAYWARLIHSGRDPMLERVAVDKPPFFLYTLARFFDWLGPSLQTGRLLNELLSLAALVLLWWLARRLYGSGLALLALAIFALSPFAIAFAPTLYTDPMLTAWVLLALVTASYGSGLAAGLALGMGFATKQTALLFIPLIVFALLLTSRKPLFLTLLAHLRSRAPSLPRPHAHSPIRPLAHSPSRPLTHSLLRLLTFAAGFYYIWRKIWQWDGWRILPAEIPNFWEQSWNSYGGLALASPDQWPQRALAWVDVWRWLGGWLPGTLVLLILTLIPGLIAIVHFKRRGPSAFLRSSHRWDALFLTFILAYALIHLIITFQPWDRYLLPLAPLLALLAARGLRMSWSRLGPRSPRSSLILAAAALVFATGASRAAAARIPVGGDHGAYAGIESVAQFLQQNTPIQRGVLYHRWLGWHWQWYLWGAAGGRVYWANPDMLLADILPNPEGYTRFVVFPGWRLDHKPELERALASRGFDLQPRFIVRRAADNGIQFIVFQILPANQPMRGRGALP